MSKKGIRRTVCSTKCHSLQLELPPDVIAVEVLSTRRRKQNKRHFLDAHVSCLKIDPVKSSFGKKQKCALFQKLLKNFR